MRGRLPSTHGDPRVSEEKEEENQPTNYLFNKLQTAWLLRYWPRIDSIGHKQFAINYTSSSFCYIYVSYRLSFTNKLLRKLLIDFIQLYTVVVDANLLFKSGPAVNPPGALLFFKILFITSYPSDNLQRCAQVQSHFYCGKCYFVLYMLSCSSMLIFMSLLLVI